MLLSKLMLTALLMLRPHANFNRVEWGIECDHGKMHLFCDSQPYSVRIPITSATQFVAHTHPDDSAAYPSANDIEVARRTGVQDLVVSPTRVYLIHADGTVTREK